MTTEWDFAIKKYSVRDLTLEDVKGMVHKALDLCRRILRASGESSNLCFTDNLLLAFEEVMAPYIAMYDISVTLNDAERALNLCLEKQGCHYMYKGGKICKEHCYNELFAEIIYAKLKEANAKKLTEEGEAVLGAIDGIEHSSYGESIKNALGVPRIFNATRECARKKLDCDEYGIKIKILCNLFYNIAHGMDEDEAETIALKTVLEECGKEKVYEVLFKK